MTFFRHLSSRLLVFFLLAAALVFAGCDTFGSDDEDDLPVAEGVVVGNGGAFGAQSGFLTVYDPQTMEKSSPASFGAFLQSMALREERLYVVLNSDEGAGRVDVRRAGGSFALIDQVLFPRSPRAIAFAEDEGTAYLPAQTLDEAFTPVPSIAYVVDVGTARIVDSVDVGRQPEGAVVAGGRAFVANYGSLGDGRTLTVIDTETNERVNSLPLRCDGPNELFEDGEGEVVVVCQGKTVYGAFPEVEEQTPGQVLFVDPESGTVTDRLRYDVPLGNGTQGAYYAEESEELFVVSDGNGQVFRIDTDANAKAETIDVPAGESLAGLAAVAYDGVAERLYLARPDAADPFASAGSVVVLSRAADGSFETTGQFVAGVAPSHISLLRGE